MMQRPCQTNACGLLIVSLWLVAPTALASAKAESAQSQPAATLVDASFVIPQRHTFGNVRLIKVDPEYAERDHQALMQAKAQIRQDLGTEWPEDTLTLAENTASLIRDLQAFNQRTNFTYHLIERTTNQVIGCVYISQPGASQYQAALYYWLIPAYYNSSEHPAIRQGLQYWLKTAWPFQAVDFSLNGPISEPVLPE